MQRDNPRRGRARDEDDDSKGDARVAIRGLLQTKRDRQQSDEHDRHSERNQIRAEKFASSAPTDAPTAVATIRSIESVSVAPSVDCMTTKVAIAAQ